MNFVTWWILKNHGLTLMGSDLTQLNIAMDWDAFIPDTMKNLNTYWVRFTREPGRIIMAVK